MRIALSEGPAYICRNIEYIASVGGGPVAGLRLRPFEPELDRASVGKRMPYAPRTHRWPIWGERFFCALSTEFFRKCETGSRPMKIPLPSASLLAGLLTLATLPWAQAEKILNLWRRTTKIALPFLAN